MNISKLTKQMILIIGISALVFIVAGIVVCSYRAIPMLPFVLGTILGSAFTALKLIMLERSVAKAVTMEEKASGSYIRLQYLFRFLLTGVVLMAGALVPFISLWGVAAGILTLQIATFFINFFIKKEDNQDILGDQEVQDNQDEKA